MQSPTTLLSSIQIMKSKLRSDKQTLMDIKNDFTKFNKKSKPYVANEQQSFMLADILQIQMNKSTKNYNSVDNSSIIKLRKQHERQIAKLKEQHQKQMNEMLRIKALQMQDIENQYKAKLQDQSHYITILQNQINTPKQSQIQKSIKQQYDNAIKNLLQDNNRLYQESKNIKDENNRLRQLCNQLQNQKSTKSRFKFTKIKKQQSLIQYQSQKSTINRFRTNSLTLNNDQNINRINILKEKQWEDVQINQDQLKIKTIRQFQKQTNDIKADRKRQECYQSLKI